MLLSKQFTIDGPWTALDPIRIGTIPAGPGTPDFYVTVESNERPLARIDVYQEYSSTFTEVIQWRNFVAIGVEDAVYLVDLNSKQSSAIRCDSYFGQFYPLGEHLLIGSASELICVDQNGEVLWRRSELGIDGVVVEEVSGGIVTGHGEWNPPGDWRTFRLSLATGDRLKVDFRSGGIEYWMEWTE